MARPNRPWYRSGMNTWFVKLNGRAVSLGVKGEGNQDAALIAFGKLLADPPTPKPSEGGPTVAELLNRFLLDARERLKPNTFIRYEYDTESARQAFGHVPASELTKHHLQDWLRSLGVEPTTKAIMLRSVSAFLGWCVREELLPFNPATKVPKPKGRSRSVEAIISSEAHQKLLAGATKQFREVLIVLKATGCRPGELSQITSETFLPDAKTVIVAEHKTDRTGKSRPILLTEEVTELLRKKLSQFPTGPLLRSRKGVVWTGRSITYAMKKLTKKVGVRAIAYGYRHTLATSLLAKGVSSTKVASILGHTGTTVIDKYYWHAGAVAEELRRTLEEHEKKNPTG